MVKGLDVHKAVKDAIGQRFRPIVMTSVAFVLGVIPLALNSGAGSGAQNLVGIMVIFGVLTATIFGPYLTPLFFMTVTTLFKSHSLKQKA